MVAQGELWLMETPNRKRRPVLVVSRDEVIPVLNNVVVAPVTSTIRDIPTCIHVGADEGLDRESVATFDNLVAVPKSVLTTRLGDLGIGGRRSICAALDALANC
ncbi:MAG TPA: type II toxin-antitoxin system PemK/MazF family toxin [Ilumatobacteraceae bacterium]